MEIFGPDPKTEKKEIISDVLDLYTEVINCDFKEVGRESVVYEKEYEKILYRLRDHFNRNLLGPGVPDFINELIEEIQPTGWIPAHTTIMTRIERGLKKIMKRFNIEIPEKKQSSNKEITGPFIQNILNANQSMNNQITISNEIRIEVDQAINEFVNEINKHNPNPSKLKKLFEIIKKGAGYGTIKVIEVLLKKLFGI